MTSEIDAIYLTGLSEYHVDFAVGLNQDAAPIYDYAWCIFKRIMPRLKKLALPFKLSLLYRILK